MATFRRFRLDDVDKLSKCNLDPLTETYELGFYLQYHAKWPSLFQVCEDQDGNIIGYSMFVNITPPRSTLLISSIAASQSWASWSPPLNIIGLTNTIFPGMLTSRLLLSLRKHA